MTRAPEDEPKNIKFLRRLVTVLTATMILGVVVVIGLLVIRLQTPPRIDLPDSISLPGGTGAQAFTQGDSWYAVVTANDQILIYDRATGALRQTIQLEN